jgi:glycerophosphoryl diester phosphodiesterase
MGLPSKAPKNTIASFEEAFKAGMNGIELDVWMTKDGKIVVINNGDTIEKTTNATGHICNLAYDDIKDLDAGSWFDSEYSSERIPLLEDVFKRYGKKMVIEIDVKNFGCENNMEKELVRLIREYYMVNRTIIISNDLEFLSQLKDLNAELTTGFWGFYKPNRYRLEYYLLSNRVDVVELGDDLASEEFIENHEHRRIHVYTVNDKKRIQELIDLGVDGIITDYPFVVSEFNHSR